MKLFSKYNRVLLITLFCGLAAIGILFYQALGYFLNVKIDESLQEELSEVRDFMHVKNITPSPADDDDLIITYQIVNLKPGYHSIRDSTFFNVKKGKKESGRCLIADVPFKGKTLRVLIIESTTERYKQAQVIFLIIIIPVILLFGVLLLINRYLLIELWQPFKQINGHIKNFNLNHNNSYQTVKTNIIEFKELDASVKEMTEQINNDYREIKLFTENASHEMMTPIAIINTKLDSILQSNSLAEDDSVTLQELYQATTRLNKINQSLLLLVKIDRNLLNDNENLSVKELLLEKADYYKELIASRHIIFHMNLDDLEVNASKYLFDVLLSNLFSNAIRHNVNGGEVFISISNKTLYVRNTGKDNSLPKDKIFERFYKNPESEGIGLGLSILKQICVKHGFILNYSFLAPYHQFTIDFT